MSANLFRIFVLFLTCAVFLVGPANSAKKTTGQNAAGDEAKSAELALVAITKANSGSYDEAINFLKPQSRPQGRISRPFSIVEKFL